MNGPEGGPGPGGFGRPSAAADAPAPPRSVASAASAGYRAEGGDLPAWSLRAASVIGARHRLSGEGTQDSYGWAFSDAGVLLVVADGVGSLPGSAAVAQAAAAAATEAALEALEGGGPVRAAVEAAVCAANASAGTATDAQPGATTLVAAGVDPSGEVVAARVGDSDARILRDGSWFVVFEAGCKLSDHDAILETAERGAGLVSTVTDALPADPPPTEWASASLSPGDALVLLTDGLARPLDDGPTTVAPTLAAGLTEPVPALDLARLIDFSRQGCHDDRTLAAVWMRRGEA